MSFFFEKVETLKTGTLFCSQLVGCRIQAKDADTKTTDTDLEMVGLGFLKLDNSREEIFKSKFL